MMVANTAGTLGFRRCSLLGTNHPPPVPAARRGRSGPEPARWPSGRLVPMGQRVLITGVSRYLGGMLAQRLEKDPDVDYVVGVDLDEPEVDLDRTEFVRADIRNPLIVKV